MLHAENVPTTVTPIMSAVVVPSTTDEMKSSTDC